MPTLQQALAALSALPSSPTIKTALKASVKRHQRPKAARSPSVPAKVAGAYRVPYGTFAVPLRPIVIEPEIVDRAPEDHEPNYGCRYFP